MLMLRHILIVLVLLAPAYGQSIVIDLQRGDTHEFFTLDIRSLDHSIQEMLDAERGLGFLDARILIHPPRSPDTLWVELVRGSESTLTNFHFPKMAPSWSDYYAREILHGEAAISFGDLNKAELWLSQQGLVRLDLRQISVDDSGEKHVSYLETKQPELRIDAMAAFNQTTTSDTLAWFGNINIMVPNLGGQGKRIELFWKRLKTHSESFSMFYHHPGLFQKPLAADLRFRRDVVDGNYQVIASQLGLEFSFDWDRKLSLLYEDQRSLITSSGSELYPDWQSTNHRSMGLGYYHNTFENNRVNGFALRSNLWQEMNFEPNSVSRLELRAEARRQIFGPISLTQRDALLIQEQGGASADPGLLHAIGGENSVRGYEEGVVMTRSYLALQHDLEWRIGPESSILAIYDLGLHMVDEDIKQLTGYGVGVQLRSSNAPIRIILASHSGLSFRNSFLHIEYKGIKRWIDRL